MALLGTCGKCGGAVTYPELWGGHLPPPARCEKCGAKPKNEFGPTIEMEDVGLNILNELKRR